MMCKMVKYSAVAVAGAFLLGGLLFGGSLFSYLATAKNSVQGVVRDNIPIEVELQRARDMVEDIVPQLKHNIREIAIAEVEIATLENDIQESENKLAEEKRRVSQLRDRLKVQNATYSIGHAKYSRQQVAQMLRDRFERYRESEVTLARKRQLLAAHQQQLAASEQLLERTRNQKAKLQQQIESLVAKHRFVQTAAVGSKVRIDDSQLTKAEKLIAEIEKRLHVAERMLAHESDFLEMETIDPISEEELLADVDDYLMESPHFELTSSGETDDEGWSHIEQ